MKKLFFFVIAALSSVSTNAQTTISLETQAYPAGVITGLRVDAQLSDQILIFGRGAINFTNRRDWGEHDNESGKGPGFGLGVELSKSGFKNLSIVLRSDLWFMDIEWKRNEVICPFVPPCFDTQVPGSSSVTVLQPTIGFAYQVPLSGSFFLKPSINLGYEINIRTKGEEVGEGAILLAGIQLVYRF